MFKNISGSFWRQKASPHILTWHTFFVSVSLYGLKRLLWVWADLPNNNNDINTFFYIYFVKFLTNIVKKNIM
jgi:predicted MFS family arabinose efflux permease